jgi:hypothetical protein
MSTTLIEELTDITRVQDAVIDSIIQGKVDGNWWRQ